MKNSTNKLRLSPMTLVMSLLLGFMIALPFKVIEDVGEDPLAGESYQELINRIAKLWEENTSLKAELAVPSESRQELMNRIVQLSEENEQLKVELDESRLDLETALMQDQEIATELSDTLGRYRILAGLEPVQGPGIRLTLSEQEIDPATGVDVAPYLIHQEDLLNIVNELWLAGAEAIAIRSGNKTERLTMRSTIRCIGPLIDVNNTRMSPPFDIFAVGNPDDLYSALTMSGGVLVPMQFFNIDTEIVILENIELPGYRGTTLLEFAQPLEEE